MRKYNLVVDENRLVRSIGKLTNTVVKIERMEPWSKRAEILRVEIVRQSKLLEKIRELKSARFN